MLSWWRNYCSRWGKDLFYILHTLVEKLKGTSKTLHDSSVAPSYRVWPFCNNHHSGCFLHLPSGKNLFQWKTWLGSGWWAIWVQRTPLLVVTLLLPIKLFHLIFKISHSEENSVGRYSMGAVQFQDRINIYLIKRSEFLTRPSKQCEFCDYLFD